LAVPTASGLVFTFCAPGRIFGGTEGVVSRFHVLRSRTRFRRYRRRRVPFSCFALLVSFSALPRASGPVFTFCAPGPVFGGIEASGPIFMFCAPCLFFCGTEGIGSRFHVLRQKRWRRVSFSSFALRDPFSVVPTLSGPVFMFCAPAPVFGGTNGFCCRFLVLRSRTHFLRYRGRLLLFS
jgi:hypothetical protein